MYGSVGLAEDSRRTALRMVFVEENGLKAYVFGGHSFLRWAWHVQWQPCSGDDDGRHMARAPGPDVCIEGRASGEGEKEAGGQWGAVAGARSACDGAIVGFCAGMPVFHFRPLHSKALKPEAGGPLTPHFAPGRRLRRAVQSCAELRIGATPLLLVMMLLMMMRTTMMMMTSMAMAYDAGTSRGIRCCMRK